MQNIFLERINQHWNISNFDTTSEFSINTHKPHARLSARAQQNIGYISKINYIGVALDRSNRWRKSDFVNGQLLQFLQTFESYCNGLDIQIIYLRYDNGLRSTQDLEQARNNYTIINNKQARYNFYDQCVNESDYQIIIISDCQLEFEYDLLEPGLIIRQLGIPFRYKRATTNMKKQIPLKREFMTFI